MSLRIGVVMDPIADIAFKKDTSLALLHAAQERGCELFYMEQSDLSIQNGKAMGRMAPLKVAMNLITGSIWVTTASSRWLS